MQIALDGPAGAGKSTIAQALAQQLHILYLDTGAMYRAFALFVLQNKVNVRDEAAVTALLAKLRLAVRYAGSRQCMFLQDEDVSDLIRTQEVGQAASVVSQYPQVRARLVELQRGIAGSQDVIMDGRDIGTRVLPQAQVKVFLTASAQERANRRVKQLEEKGVKVDYEDVFREIVQRDLQDTTREADPLRQAEDAYRLDSTNLTQQEVVSVILDLVENAKK